VGAAAGAVLRAAGLQYARRPINLVLLVVLPPLFVLALAGAVGTFSGVLGGNLTERTASALGALWAGALLAGSAAFFLISGGRRADERLVVAGVRRSTLGIAHGLALAVLAVITATIAFGVVVATHEIRSPLDLWAGLVLGALAYEGLGIALAFFVDGDLEGSFVIVLVFMFDAFVAGPLGGASGLWPNLFPLHHPSQLVIDAAVSTDVDRTRYAWSVVYTLGLLALAAVAHVRRST